MLLIDLSFGFVNSLICWLVVMSGMHNADETYSIQSTWLCCWLYQFITLALNTHMDSIKILGIVLDLCTIYVSHFSGCYILECYNLFSGVRLSIQSFCFNTVS